MSIISAMTQWWNEESKIHCHMEQVVCSTPLSEIALYLNLKKYLSDNSIFESYNYNCKVFQKIWNKYKTSFISDFSPMSSFLLNPQFQQTVSMAYFDHWKRAGLVRFYNLGNDESGLFPEE